MHVALGSKEKKDELSFFSVMRNKSIYLCMREICFFSKILFRKQKG